MSYGIGAFFKKEVMYDRIRIRRNNRLDHLGFDNAEKKVVFSCKTLLLEKFSIASEFRPT